MKKLTMQNSYLHSPPEDWSDRKGWDRYLNAQCLEGPFPVPTAIGAYGWQSVRFLDFVKARGGRVWFPGCGVDVGPRFYASVGCRAGNRLLAGCCPSATSIRGHAIGADVHGLAGADFPNRSD